MGFLSSVKTGVKAFKHIPGCTTERNGYTVMKYLPTYYAFKVLSAVKRYRINVHGIEHIQEGPAWIVSKHTHDKDIPDLSSALYKKTEEVPYFVARDDLCDDGWEKAQYLELGAIFINRENPSMDTIKDIIGTVGKGNQVVIFPEGTRMPHELGEFHRGAAMMAHQLYENEGINAPIYCVGVRRPKNPKAGVVINIAPPMYITDFTGSPRAKRRAATEKMRQTVGFLCSQEGRETDHVRRIEALEELIRKWAARGKNLILAPTQSATAAQPL